MLNHGGRLSDTEIARGLGWASVGIGLTELAAPRQVQDMLGVEDRPDHRGILRVLGIRELMHGLGILTEERPDEKLTAGVWSRVAGDLLDTVLLAAAGRKTRRPASFAAVSAMVMGIGLLDILAAARLTGRQRRRRWRWS